MRDFTKLATSVWHSDRFQKLSDAGKLFYLYAVGSPSVNSAGYYKLKIGYAMADLGWNEKKIRDAVDEVIQSGLLQYDFKEQVCLIDKHFQINPPTNPKHAAKVLSDILSIAYTDLRNEVLSNFISYIKEQSWELPPKSQEVLDSLSIAPLFLERERESKTERERERETIAFNKQQQPEKKSEAKKPKEPFILPDWIPPDLWAAYRDHRRKLKKPMTEYAEKCAVKDLERLRESGNDPIAVINQTISRGWTGFFELKQNQQSGAYNDPSTRPATKSQRADQAAQRALDRLNAYDDEREQAMERATVHADPAIV